ncbi:MAG: MAPEG family protein, partial [Undibacterium sp.]|nr:MAPEG family protein [Undibacterium sp.]
MTHLNHNSSLVFACIAMFFLTAIVGVRMFTIRVKEIKRKRIRVQEFADSVKIAGKMEDVQASDNYKNLFEQPVLFYALCLLVIQTGIDDPVLQIGAWFFVALRYAHSFIHCGYNKVIHRFRAFAGAS